MLSDPDTCGGSHKCTCCRDIKFISPGTASATGIYKTCVVDLNTHGKLSHHFSGTDNFINRLTLQAKSNEETSNLGVSRLACHDQPHHYIHLALGKMISINHFRDSSRHIHYFPFFTRLRKLPRRSCPCSVRIDSGWN